MAQFDIPLLDPITRGDREKLFFQLMQAKENEEDPDEPQSISGWTLRFGAKLDLSDSTYIVQKNSATPGHFEIEDATQGTGYIVLAPADLQGVTYETTLICDLEATDIEGNPFTTRFRVPVELDVST
jgi:hypothetical protein